MNIKINNIYNMDCIEGLKLIQDKTIDTVITDPPYNIADNSKLTKKGNKIINNKEAWGRDFKDNWKTQEDYINWLLERTQIIYNKLKDNSSMLMFLNRKTTGLIIDYLEKQGWKYKNKLYFIKNNPLPHIRKNNYRSCVEECIWMSKGNGKVNFLSQNKMKQIFYGNIGNTKETNHPTEKYEWMIVPLILRHTNENNIILDPFMGSGTTAISALKHNRNYIGFEIEEKYCKMATERVNNYNKQTKLF